MLIPRLRDSMTDKYKQMKKLILLVLIVCTNLPSAFAQSNENFGNIKVEFGELTNKYSGDLIKIIGETETNIYGLSLKGKNNYYLLTYDPKSMQITNETEIDLPKVEGKKVELDDLVLVGDNVYVIGSFYKAKTKESYLVAFRFKNNLTLDKNEIVLFASEAEKHSEKGSFAFKTYKRNKKLLAVYGAVSRKSETLNVEIALFDEALTEVTRHSEAIEFDKKSRELELDIHDFILTKNEDILLSINQGYRDPKEKIRVENFEIVSYKKEKDYLKESIKVPLPDKYILTSSLIQPENNLLQIVGYYGITSSRGRQNLKYLGGIFDVVVNLDTKQIENEVFNYFDDQTRIDILGERKARRGKEIINNYSILNTLKLSDESTIIVSEYRTFELTGTTGIGPLMMNNFQANYNEIIVTKLDKNGNAVWNKVIPKEQKAKYSTLHVLAAAVSFNIAIGAQIPITAMGKGPEFIGFIPLAFNDDLYFLFSDNPKNEGIINVDEAKPMTNLNKSVPTVFKITKDGELTRYDPEEAKKQDVLIMPGIFGRNAADDVIIYASKKSKECLGRLYFGFM